MPLPDYMATHLIDAGFPGLITKSLQQVWRERVYGRPGRVSRRFHSDDVLRLVQTGPNPVTIPTFQYHICHVINAVSKYFL